MATPRDPGCSTDSPGSDRPGPQQAVSPKAPLYLQQTLLPQLFPTPGLGTGADAGPSFPQAAVKPSQSPASYAKASPPGQEGICFGASRQICSFPSFYHQCGAWIGVGRATMLAGKWIPSHAWGPGSLATTHMFFWARMMALTSSTFTMLRMRLQKTLEAESGGSISSSSSAA